MELKRYMDSRQVGAMLGYHYRTIQRKAHAGEIPGTRIGGVWKFDPTRLENWMQKRIDKQAIK